MTARMLKGAKGDLYVAGSAAVHLALQQLWKVLNGIGFRVDKKRDREATLRVYVKE